MANQVIKPVKNCFGVIPPENLGPQLEPVEFDKTRQEVVLVPYSTQVGDDPENIVLQYKPVVKNEYDIQEYIESFADEVGIQNILKKLSLSGDKSLLNQTHREPLCPEGGLEPVQDYSNVPGSKTEAFNSVIKGVNAFDNLPEDLKGKLSMSQFVQLVGQEEFDKYIADKMAALQPKEGDK